MKLSRRLLNGFVRGVVRLLMDVDVSETVKLPQRGPAILLFNHINFTDAPVFYSHLGHLPITAFAKTETWDNPIIGKMFTIWEAIPLRRNEADLSAFEQAREQLALGKMLAIAPEGTRSGTGQLGPGNPGILLLALRSNAPIIPLVHYGVENLKPNLRRFKRTPFKVLVGQPFTIRQPEGGLTRDVRKQMVDEVMYQMAALLPPQYRGVYADLSKATEEYLEFQHPAQSNLAAASNPLRADVQPA